MNIQIYKNNCENQIRYGANEFQKIKPSNQLENQIRYGANEFQK